MAILEAKINFRHRSATAANASIRASMSEISSAGSSSVIGRSSKEEGGYALLTHPTDSQRQIVVLLRRRFHLLVLQHRQRPRDPLAGRMRHDDVVDVAALGCNEGRQAA